VIGPEADPGVFDVRIYRIQQKEHRRRPFVVRWRVRARGRGRS
jgi:hypothetical protein